MKRLIRGSLALATLVAAAFLTPLPRSASAEPDVLYGLGEGSDFEMGCFGPCACPILIVSPLTGSFVLSPMSTDPVERTYSVTNIEWKAPFDSSGVHAVGSGIYRIVSGGARTQHQMKVRLRVNDNAEQEFDSGLVPGGDEFPAINIQVATNGFFCWDTVFTVHARPASVVGDVGQDGTSFALLGAQPNPFAASTWLRFALPEEATIDLRVYDGLGRVVRTLVTGRVPAGIRLVEWNGRKDNGESTAPGLYFVRLTSQDRKQVRAVAKVR